MKKLILLLCTITIISCGGTGEYTGTDYAFISPVLQPYFDELEAAGLVLPEPLTAVIGDYMPSGIGALAFRPNNVILYHPDWSLETHEQIVLRSLHELAHIICNKGDTTDNTILNWTIAKYESLQWYIDWLNDGCPPDVSWQ